MFGTILSTPKGVVLVRYLSQGAMRPSQTIKYFVKHIGGNYGEKISGNTSRKGAELLFVIKLGDCFNAR
jgi:hypothetical protein